ncbi:MAG: SEC-C domain-containing protein, partial [Novosphingobium sp.]|nr:SEC-C domain-containing protein [Novosphingobium sp.]
FGLFEKMLETIREDVTRILSTSELRMPEPAEMALPELPEFMTAGQFDPFDGDAIEVAGNPQAAGDPYAGMGLSRNAPCPCGSGRKYKHCHGKIA